MCLVEAVRVRMLSCTVVAQWRPLSVLVNPERRLVWSALFDKWSWDNYSQTQNEQTTFFMSKTMTSNRRVHLGVVQSYVNTLFPWANTFHSWIPLIGIHTNSNLVKPFKKYKIITLKIVRFGKVISKSYKSIPTARQ